MKTMTYQPSSSYVDQDYYDWLVAFSSDLRNNEARLSRVGQPDEYNAVAELLKAETVLLDEQRLHDWLALFAQECVYWIPGDTEASDPRQAVTLELHDRRRLLDRVARLETGLAYSQLPPSRTTRIIGTPAVWASPGNAGVWHARCNFMLDEFRRGHQRHLSGWYGFAIGQGAANGYEILVKQINLFDSDEVQGNNSFFL